MTIKQEAISVASAAVRFSRPAQGLLRCSARSMLNFHSAFTSRKRRDRKSQSDAGLHRPHRCWTPFRGKRRACSRNTRPTSKSPSRRHGARRATISCSAVRPTASTARTFSPRCRIDFLRQGHPEQRADADVHSSSGCNSMDNVFRLQRNSADLKIGLDTRPFKEALEKKKASGKPVKAATLSLAAHTTCGFILPPPAASTRTRTSKPSRCRLRKMVANMKVGTMDCFCVCEPWIFSLSIRTSATPQSRLANFGTSIRKNRSHCARPGWTRSKFVKALLMAVMEAQQSGATSRKPSRARRHHGETAMDQCADRRHHRPHQWQIRLRPARRWSRTLPTS